MNESSPLGRAQPVHRRLVVLLLPARTSSPAPVRTTAVTVLCTVLALVGLVSAGALAPASAAEPSATQTVSFGGVAVDVPASWSVVDLTANPKACVRYDRPTVYLGELGTQEECPARVVGVTDTLWLKPAATERAAQPRIAGLSNSAPALLSQHNVIVEETRDSTSSVLASVLASVRGISNEVAELASPAAAATRSTSTSSASSTTVSPSTSSAAAAVPHATAATTHTGMGFDACTAPAVSTMNAWLQSPYRSVGIYIGGVNRGCTQANLTASWVTQVRALGWGMVPTYVGLQAPCYGHTGSKIDPAKAAQQGTESAQDAAAKADALGLGAGSPIYFDMEAYTTGSGICTNAVLAFLSAWAKQLHAEGYLAGAYGSMASLMTDLSNNYNNSSYTRQDDVWFAHYNGEQSANDSASFPAFKDSYWVNHRLHQYLGGHQQTWGGVTINIDENWNNGRVSGTAVPVDYGAGAFGPGGSRFFFTGSMARWNPDSSQGVKKMSYWTTSAGATESDGATWQPSLGQQGLYEISAFIPKPAGKTGAKATYSVRAVEGTIKKTIDQSQASGYTTLGQYRTKSTTPFIVHVGDNDATSTSKVIGVDAMRFTYIAGYPGQPTSVTASGGDNSATVSWNAAPDNGAAITKYTVTASPGNTTTVVDGSTTSADFRGLINGTTYTFTVVATNAVGDGPKSLTTTPVTPQAGSGTYHPLTPSRILDTAHGQGGITLRAGSNQRVQIAGYGGVPFNNVNSVVLSVQALNTTATSYLSVTPSNPSATSQLSFSAGQQVGGLIQATLDDNTGAVLLRLGAGSADIIFDVLGYYGSDAGGAEQVALTPSRVFDTTSSRNPIRAGQPRTVKVAGIGGIPANATAVVISAQALNASYSGNDYLSVTPSSPQAISQLNVTRGQHSSGLIISSVGSNGTVLARVGNGSADVIFDITGYFLDQGGDNVYHPLVPFRAYQTGGNRLSVSEGLRTIQIPRLPDNAEAVMLSLQALNASVPSYLSITPQGFQSISELNFPIRSQVSGAAIVPLGPNNTVTLRIGAGSADFILDVAGYYGP